MSDDATLNNALPLSLCSLSPKEEKVKLRGEKDSARVVPLSRFLASLREKRSLRVL
jgi:hypothetical protein